MGFLQLLKMVGDGRIFCSCDTCKSFTSVSLPEFRQHCGCVDGDMENSIYFGNNKTMSEAMEAMNGDSMDLIKLSLQEVVGLCPEKRTYTCRDYGGSCPPSSSFESIKRCSTITTEELGSSSTSQQILTSDSKITTVDLHVSLGKQCVQRHNCTPSNEISNRTPQVQDVETSLAPQEESEACLGPENSYVVDTLEEPVSQLMQ